MLLAKRARSVYLKEIPCLNKVTIPYHTIPLATKRDSATTGESKSAYSGNKCARKKLHLTAC